ncbi:MAG: benzoyl-CoA-dihydrodiol lyase [Alphaproteobacteria bacterium]|jgi:benzoyl-CoA-dihydrodiol lyase|nr:benzoyl-CoA-dihydrodiol lyase [Alphaproteobacteria bacterium]
MNIDFETHPKCYRHWRLSTAGQTATLTLDVDEAGGLFEGYELKLNSYDLGVDIELADAIQRLRFEHPEVKVVVMRSGKDRVFCAGANIRMLAGASHGHKVNFCKFTNETRNAIEDASGNSGQRYLAAVTGACAGGGYELALAADHILLVDDGSTTISLPEVPLLAVLPGTGGLTRIVDKRFVRRDLADLFSTTEEGVRGQRAVDWKLVDEIAPASRIEEAISARANAMAETSQRPDDAKGIALGSLDRVFSDTGVLYSTVAVELDRESRIATVTVTGPETDPPASADGLAAQGDHFWPLRAARELDDAFLHLRFNERDIAVVQLRTEGEAATMLAHDAFLDAHSENWLVGEIRLLWKRVLTRIDLTARSMVALIEPGSCFAGTLAELAFAVDRSYMALGPFEGDNRPEAALTLSAMNFGPYPMSNGLTRLQTRFLGDGAALQNAVHATGKPQDAEDALALGLATIILDDIDWEDEIRIFVEERASFSADALTAMEANLRFAGPETMETKIFGRLTAWQNWVFQRPNAVGEEGALRRYGTGRQPDFNTERI